MKKSIGLIFLAVAVSARVAAAQTLLTSSFGGTQATSIAAACPSGYCFGNGPTAVGFNGYNVTYTATYVPHPDNKTPLLSGPGYYGLGSNGYWYNVAFAATNGPLSSIFLTFGAPVSMVGGIMNYSPGTGTPWLRAYDAADNLIGAYDLSVAGGGISTVGVDQGAFRGVSYAGGIAKLELQGSYALTQDLYVNADVPEPGSFALVGSGLVGLAMVRRRRRA